ncbi:MAG: hypothetical protein A2015_11530 [Spirochaetes bacterium GWF1_31_7]|nr:MAG: hypothetical protein A2Y30_15545 [Spirochaetes bacterium GWE1_32_154]OHD49054.1 MAG: hypothetical protein A2015_11530 [Spirochaetes bacterium GWF1_31_7]OHD50362.1 MAG: hypothetical protein A2Y29_13595 [Spirochaetes bacterium GWE2_31_10]HBD93849.1 hypothetical protein [Spirochaetia bacterium]HBI38844.1 hypothetical protein [Spirochaetia bacterium]
MKFSINSYYNTIDGGYIVKKGAIDPVFSIVDSVIPVFLQKYPDLQLEPEIWQVVSTVDNRSPFKNGLFSFITIGGVHLHPGNIYYDSLLQGLSGVQNGCLISESIALRYAKKTGDTITVNNHELKVSGIYKTGSFYLDCAIIMDFNVIRSYISIADDKVSSYYISSDTIFDFNTLKNDIDINLPDYELKNANVFSEDFKGVIDTVKNFSLTILVIIFVFIIMIFINTTSIILKEYESDIYIMLREGWGRKDLFGLYFSILIAALFVSVITSLILYEVYSLYSKLIFAQGDVFPFAHFLMAIIFSIASLTVSLLYGLIKLSVKSPVGQGGIS